MMALADPVGVMGVATFKFKKNGRKNWNETRQNRSKRLYYIYLCDFYVLYTFIYNVNKHEIFKIFISLANPSHLN